MFNCFPKMKCLALLIFVVVAQCVSADKDNLYSALRKSLLDGYDKLVPQNDPFTLSLGFSVVDMNLCSHKELLVTDAWLRMKWQDDRLKYNASLWGGIDALRISYGQIFIPDVSFYNAVNQVNFLQPEKLNNVLIYPDGSVLFVPSVVIKSRCPINFDNWPWSKQV